MAFLACRFPPADIALPGATVRLGIVRSYDLMTRGFRSFGGRFFPTVLERTLHSHDLQGGFFTFREACEIRSVSQAEDPGPGLLEHTRTEAGDLGQSGLPRWDTKWEDELGPPVTPQIVRDSVRAEHAFTWPPSGKDARIYETSRHWRDAAELDLALSSEVPLPFMSVDGKQIVWATYERTRQRLSMFDPARQKDAREGGA